MSSLNTALLSLRCLSEAGESEAGAVSAALASLPSLRGTVCADATVCL